jgi:hypothetical protein
VPSITPATAATRPTAAASTRIIDSSCRRVSPSARSTPIKPRRCSTEKFTALKIRKSPTSSASRLMAVRFVMKAWLISAVERVRPAAESSCVPGPRAFSSLSSILASPSAIRTSMRLSQPGRFSHSCAVAMSVTNTRSRLLSAAKVATSVPDCGLPPANSWNVSPTTSPRSSAVCVDVVTAPGSSRNLKYSDESSSPRCPAAVSPVKLRIDCSAKRSMPSSCSGMPSTFTVPSTTGATLVRPSRVRRFR